MNTPLLGVFGVTCHYREHVALDEVSFELEAGEILALVGPNGSGKSTLLKAIAGLLPLRGAGRAGQVRVSGHDFLSLDSGSRARQIAYLGEEPRAEFPITAWEAVSLGRFAHGGAQREDASVRAAMERTLTWALRDRHLDTLSGGERQRVSVARALAQGARLLFLDEALSKMDLHHQAWMGKLLRELAQTGYGIILVSHDLNFAGECASSVLLLQAGRKRAHGPTREVLTTERLAEMYPGAHLLVGANPATGAPQVFFGASGGAPSSPQK